MSYTREECLTLLHQKREALRDAGEERYPRRGDFSEPEAAAIKACLGPWPRALEAAGVKPPNVAREEKRLRRRAAGRQRARQRKLAARQNAQASLNDGHPSDAP